MDTLTVAGAFKGHPAFMGKSAVEFDLFADSRFIFPDSLCDSGLGGTVGDTGKDDASFLQSQMRK